MSFQRTYASREVFEMFDINAQQVQYWIFKRIFDPYDFGRGTGSTRRFSFSNLMEIGLILELLKDNLKLASVASIISNVRKKNPVFFKPPHGKTKKLENEEVLAYRFEKTASGKSWVRSEVFPIRRTVGGINSFFETGYHVSLINLDRLKGNLIQKIPQG